MANDRIVLTRRRFLGASVSTAAMTMAGGIARPYLSRAADRPLITHGLQSGDVGDRFRRGLGPRRPAGAHAGRDLHHRQLQDHPPRRVRRCAAGERLHRQGRWSKTCRPGQDIFYRIRFQDLSSPTIVGEPMVGRFRTAPARPPLDLVRLVRRHRGPGLGHRRGARRHAHLRHHAQQPAGFLHPLAATRSTPTARWSPNSSCRTASSGRTSSPRRNRRRPRRWPSFAATTNTTCSTRTCLRSTPKSRCSRSGTTTRSPTTGGRASR